MLNRLVYISKLKVSPEDIKYSRILVKILRESVTYNQAHGVTGVLFVSGKSCIQVLEGEALELGRLMFKISRDARHKNVLVLYKCRVEQRLYTDWNMRIATAGTEFCKDAVLALRCADRNVHCSLQNKVKMRLDNFFDEVTGNTTVKEDWLRQTPGKTDYTNTYLSMVGWPRASQLQLTSKIVRLCGCLTGKGMAYEELCLKHIYASRDDLNSILETLSVLGLLRKCQLTDVKNKDRRTALSRQPKRKSDHFSLLLRKFITSRVCIEK